MKPNLERIICLEHDAPSKAISKFFQRLWPSLVHPLRFPDRGEITRKAMKGLVEHKIPVGNNLTVYGHGGCHHYTYGLCTGIADKVSKKYAYLHFDNHDDFYSDERLDCGSFVEAILEDSHAHKVPPIFIGSSKATSYSDECLRRDVNSARALTALKRKLARRPKDVYLTFDLDVMGKDEIETWYGQNDMRMESLLRMVDAVLTKKRIIGADILGSSDQDDRSGHLLYAILAGRLIGLETAALEKKRHYFFTVEPLRKLYKGRKAKFLG